MSDVWIETIESCPDCGVENHMWMKHPTVRKKTDINEQDYETPYQPKPWCDCVGFSGTIKSRLRAYEPATGTLLVMDEEATWLS